MKTETSFDLTRKRLNQRMTAGRPSPPGKGQAGALPHPCAPKCHVREMNTQTQRAERTAYVVSVAIYPVVWFLACLYGLRNLETVSVTWLTLGFAVVVSLSYVAGQLLGAYWTGKTFLCADPVAIPLSVATYFALGILLLRLKWITKPELAAVGAGAVWGFMLGHPIALGVAVATDRLLKRLMRNGDCSP